MSEIQHLQREVERLRNELREAEETVRAIHDGRVDAFIVEADQRDRVYLLESIDAPFRILVERMQQGAVTVAADGTVLYANRQLSSLLGRSRELIVGRPLTSFVIEADRPLLAALIGGEVERPQGELRLAHANGARVPVYISAGSLSASGAGETCLLVTDLTQQKQHEDLIAAETLARSVLEQAADAVVVCDTDGLIVLASPAAHEMCGRNPLWQPFTDVLPLVIEQRGREPEPHFEPAQLESCIRGVEAYLECAGEKPMALLLSAAPVHGPRGSRLGSVVTLADISALKQAEEELKAADRRKDEFLAMLAHELRNPLAPIVSGLEVLQLSDVADDGSAPVFRMIRRQVDQLVRLVDDLLEVSRIARGKIELRKEVVELGDVLSDALETSRPLIDAMKHTLDVDVPTETVLIECDGVRISQVIANLLNNAAKYTPRGGQLSLSARVDGDQVELRVRDTGYGIEPDALDSVFEMFTQARLSSRAESGLGVGLSLVRTLVEMHGGSVRARSEGRDCGSEFIVRLPSGAVPQDRETGSAGPTVAGDDIRRILVVDDNRDSANSLGMLLDMLDYEARVAFDGASALDELERFDAQAVFLDIDMPGMGGLEVARRIRARPDGADVVLVALTGWGQDNDRARSRHAGFNHHLLKPVTIESLRTVLAAATERYNAKTGGSGDRVTH